MSRPVSPAVTLHRLGYRAAYRLLQVRWALLRPHLRGVKCLITDRDDRLLLVRHTYGARDWDLPGGVARRDEPFLATARREMEEELGLGAPWRDLGILRDRLHGRHETVGLLGASIDARPLRLDPVEIGVAAFFARDRLPLDLAPLVRPILENVLAPGRR